MPYLEWEGIYRGSTNSWEIWESKSEDSQSVAVNIKFDAIETLDRDANEWCPLDKTYHTSGPFWVIKKDGSINAKVVENLCDVLGWSGSLTEVAHNEYISRPCQFTVKAETYNGNTRHNAAFINAYDYSPRGGGRSEHASDETSTGKLDAKYGSQLRAIAAAAAKEGSHGGSTTPNAGSGSGSDDPPEHGTIEPEKGTKTPGGQNGGAAFDEVPF